MIRLAGSTLGSVGDVDAAELVLRAAAGDEDAWGSLVERYSEIVWSVARGHGLSHADAADVSQTTWLRLAEHLRDIHSPDKVCAWLVTTARRESLRTLRRSSRQVLVDSCLDISTGFCVDDEVVGSEGDEQLWRAFEALSGPCKALLRILMSDPAPSYQDVSEAFEMPVGSIGPTRARCLDRLRACVTRSGVFRSAVARRGSEAGMGVRTPQGVTVKRRAS